MMLSVSFYGPPEEIEAIAEQFDRGLDNLIGGLIERMNGCSVTFDKRLSGDDKVVHCLIDKPRKGD